uniref:Uncharacterized protein n=1 Tax=Timema douglasi TaxID=61478 RepID=A0A7R8VG84_TIMDO|nr:unnamed protein product [Timema douglasi]
MVRRRATCDVTAARRGVYTVLRGTRQPLFSNLGKMSEETKLKNSSTDTSFKIKAGLFLASVAGAASIIGFGSTLAAAKKQDAVSFNKGVLGSIEMTETEACVQKGPGSVVVEPGIRGGIAAKEFEPVKCELPDITASDLSTDQLYLLEVAHDVQSDPGPLSYSRWFTTANSILRLSVATETPSSAFRSLVQFVMKDEVTEPPLLTNISLDDLQTIVTEGLGDKYWFPQLPCHVERSVKNVTEAFGKMEQVTLANQRTEHVHCYKWKDGDIRCEQPGGGWVELQRKSAQVQMKNKRLVRVKIIKLGTGSGQLEIFPNFEVMEDMRVGEVTPSLTPRTTPLAIYQDLVGNVNMFHICFSKMRKKLQQMLLGQTSESSKHSAFHKELCEAFIYADISLSKVNNPRLRDFLEKHTGKSLPDSSTPRKHYVNRCYENTMKKIQEKVAEKKIWVSMDETTDYVTELLKRFEGNSSNGIIQVGRSFAAGSHFNQMGDLGIEACNYYCENLQVVKKFIDSFDSNEATTIKVAQELLSDPEIAVRLMHAATQQMLRAGVDFSRIHCITGNIVILRHLSVSSPLGPRLLGQCWWRVTRTISVRGETATYRLVLGSGICTGQCLDEEEERESDLRSEEEESSFCELESTVKLDSVLTVADWCTCQVLFALDSELKEILLCCEERDTEEQNCCEEMEEALSCSVPITDPGAIGGRSVLNRGDLLGQSDVWPSTNETFSPPERMWGCSVDVLDELSQQQHEELPFSNDEPVYNPSIWLEWKHITGQRRFVEPGVAPCTLRSRESRLPADALSSDEVSSGDLLRRLILSKLAVSPEPLPLLFSMSESSTKELSRFIVGQGGEQSIEGACWMWEGRWRRLGGSGGGSLDGGTNAAYLAGCGGLGGGLASSTDSELCECGIVCPECLSKTDEDVCSRI